MRKLIKAIRLIAVLFCLLVTPETKTISPALEYIQDFAEGFSAGNIPVLGHLMLLAAAKNPIYSRWATIRVGTGVALGTLSWYTCLSYFQENRPNLYYASYFLPAFPATLILALTFISRTTKIR